MALLQCEQRRKPVIRRASQGKLTHEQKVEAYQLWLGDELTVREIAAELGVAPRTFYKAVREIQALQSDPTG